MLFKMKLPTVQNTIHCGLCGVVVNDKLMYQLLPQYFGLLKTNGHSTHSKLKSPSRLKAFQNKCIRIMTGQYSSAPIEALRAEISLPPIESVIKANCLRAWKKGQASRPSAPSQHH